MPISSLQKVAIGASRLARVSKRGLNQQLAVGLSSDIASSSQLKHRQEISLARSLARSLTGLPASSQSRDFVRKPVVLVRLSYAQKLPKKHHSTLLILHFRFDFRFKCIICFWPV